MVTVTFDGTRVNGAGDGNATTGFTAWGATVTAEPDYYYTNGYCISAQVKTAEVGFYCTGGSTVDFSSPVRVWLAKFIQTNYTAIDGLGLQLFLGNDTTNHWRYEIYTAATYPAAGGFQIVPIDPNVAGYYTQTVGSPSLTSIDFYGIKSDANATAKAPNLGMDAVDYITAGTGLSLTGTSGSFTDFVTFDEGTTTNRYGIITSREGVYYLSGVITIGSAATSAVFTDENRTIVFPDGRFNTGFCGIDLDLTQSATSVSITSCTFVGRGRRGYGDFDTTQDVNGTTEIITTAQVHNFTTGDAATYSKNGGSGAIGLTDATVYYINAISTTTLYVYDTKANAIVGSATGRQNLTATSAANSERHLLTRTSESRPDIGITGTGSTSGATFDACAFINFNALVLNSKVTITDSSFNSCQTLTQATAVITGCTFDTPPLAMGTAFLTCNDPAKITLSNFTSGSFGHALELTTATAGNSYTFSGNTFTGYGPVAIDFHTTTDVNATTDVVTQTAHGYATGDAIRYMKHGGSVNMGLTDNTTYYVRAVTVDTLGFYDSEYEAVNNSGQIALTSTGSETHYIYSMNAAIYNNSGGAVTINVTNSGTYPLSVRNSSASSTTVSSSVSVTVAIKDTAGAAIPGVEVAIFQDNAARTVVLASTATNASGEVSTSVAASLGAIIIRARQSTIKASFLTNSSGIDDATDVITTLGTAHNLDDGVAVVYSKNGGTQNINLTAGNTYYVNKLTATTLSLHPTIADAFANTNKQAINVAGAETHTLDPVRYVPASATGTIGAGAFSAQITMITDSIATG